MKRMKKTSSPLLRRHPLRTAAVLQAEGRKQPPRQLERLRSNRKLENPSKLRVTKRKMMTGRMQSSEAIRKRGNNLRKFKRNP